MIQSSTESFAPEEDCGLLGEGRSQFECGCPHGDEHITY